jgi:hypothetical protein
LSVYSLTEDEIEVIIYRNMCLYFERQLRYIHRTGKIPKSLTSAERKKLRSQGLINYRYGGSNSKFYYVESRVWNFLDEK